MDKRRLESLMKLFGDTQATLAKAMGLSTSRLNAKINEYRGAEFKQNEINLIRERYKLSSEEVERIFFISKVSFIKDSN